MHEPVIVAAGRTPIGRAHRGSLADMRPDDLLAQVYTGLLDPLGIDPGIIDDIQVGNVMSYGEQEAGALQRGATFLAGWPETIPGATINRQCGSSLEAIRSAAHAIAFGDASVVLAAGVECVSRAPQVENLAIPHPMVFSGEIPNIYIAMGETAERVADTFHVSREDMDVYAQQSQARAVDAQKRGVFEREIIPVHKPDGTLVEADDGPRPSSTLDKLRELPPVFREDGRVTAGNSCPLNDGAAAVLVMSADRAHAEGLTPIARVLGSAVSGLAPEIMGVGPIEAVRKLLARLDMTVGDIDVLELNEAFASQVLAVVRELGIDPASDVLNPHGGAIALGHPFGQTGARIMTTLLNDLQTLDRTIGVETMCCGGGQGIALAVERLA